MIHIGICDDDRMSIANISEMLKNMVGSDYQITEFTKGEDLEAYLDELESDVFHILFLDINLITQNGISLAEKIKTKFPAIKIIFISGNILYCQDVFGVQPTGFLIKPIQQNKLKAALDLAMINDVADECEMVAVHIKNKIRKIPASEILYIESKLRKICFITKKENIVVYGKLSDIMQELSPKFLRCHTSYIVNLDAVVALEKNKLLLSGNRSINVSQTYYKKTKEAFVNYLGGLL